MCISIYFHNFFSCRSHVVEKICQYLTHNVHYSGSAFELPEFPISPEISLDLLMADISINANCSSVSKDILYICGRCHNIEHETFTNDTRVKGQVRVP